MYLIGIFFSCDFNFAIYFAELKLRDFDESPFFKVIKFREQVTGARFFNPPVL